MTFKIHKARDMSDVFDKVEEWLRSDDCLPASLLFTDFRLIYRGMELKDSDTLKQAGIEADAKIFVFLVLEKSPVREDS